MSLENTNRASGAVIAFIIGSLIFIVLSVVAKFAVTVPDIDADPGALRSRALVQMRAVESTNLTELGWADVSRGLVRLPIETAMQKAEKLWQNPAQARAELIAREKKAVAPAPTRPVKPSAFE
ncbi:MAG TPA: hypothetical protein VGO57_12985 [Verrucomicrobiae bacterium]|jgi:hypothetical protein